MTTNFLDFTHRRVRCNGRVLSKDDMARLVDTFVSYRNEFILQSVLSYSEVAYDLLRYAAKGRNFFNDEFVIIS